jgi:hypothetical protein
MAADSRISDAEGKLIDEAIKVFELPVVCRDGSAGVPGVRRLAGRSIGMLATGSSLVYQNVQGTLGAILANLIGPPPGPTIEDVAGLAATITTLYVRSLGENRPEGAELVGIVVGGVSESGEPEAFELTLRHDAEGRFEFGPTRVELRRGHPRFFGYGEERAEERYREIACRDEPGAPAERAALNVIRDFIDDPETKPVGGEIQIGLTVGADFHRVASVRPLVPGEPGAVMLDHSIELGRIGPVGRYAIGIIGMVAP